MKKNKIAGTNTMYNTTVNSKTANSGITLIALVVTIIVLLILAGITIQVVLQGGIIGQANNAGEQYKIAAAREKLSITLSSAQMDKATNIKYNQEDYLDEFIVNNTSNTEVIDNIVITDGYAFELDRSVPKIGEYLGKKEELVFPEVSTTVTLAEDYKTATITINAKEETNGISKIEVLQGGYVLETYTYENKKEPIIENYIAKYNGTYVIKVYANFTVKEKTEVEGLVSSVIYSPEKNEKYQKEHQVKITVQDEADKVISLKYQWLQTTVEPAPETFTNTCNNNEVITGRDFTGIYYLWTLLETQSGKTNICRSEGFYFDNKGPTVTLTSTPVSQNSFTLTATANDEHSSIAKYEFYVENELKETIETSEKKVNYKVTGVSTGNNNCYVIVSDILKNTTKEDITAKTKMYTWEKWNITEKVNYTIKYSEEQEIKNPNIVGQLAYSSIEVDEKTGKIVGANGRHYLMSPSWGKLSPGYEIVDGGQKAYYWCAPVGSVITPPRYNYCNRKTCTVEISSRENVQGTSMIGLVEGKNRNAYKDGDGGDGYWYKYLGIK